MTLIGLWQGHNTVLLDGWAFDVETRAAGALLMTVIDLHLAADTQSVDGILYDGNTAKRKMANDLFEAVNQAGHLS